MMDYGWLSVAELQRKLAELLHVAHGIDVTRFEIGLEGDTVVLAGEVASEEARSDAKMFALGFERVLKVRNELVVAGYFFAASDDGDSYFTGGGDRGTSGQDDFRSRGSPPKRRKPAPALKASPGGAPEEVIRYPSVAAAGEFAPAQNVELAIDLTEDPEAGGTAISLGEFPADATSIIVTVQVFASWAREMETITPEITLTRTGSEPARFRFIVAEDYVPGTPAPVQISFLNGTRVCGHLSRDLADGPKDLLRSDGRRQDIAGEDDHVDQTAARIVPAAVRVVPNASGPTLSATILSTESGQQVWMWKAFLPEGQLDGSQSIRNRTGEQEFAEQLLASCPDLADDEFRRTMAGIGERIWQATPGQFRSTYLRCRSAYGAGFPIQLITGDPYVPWEMMKPDLQDEVTDHMFFDHPISRWPVNVADARRSGFLAAARLSFVPTYSDADLPFAQAEGEWLERTLGAVRMDAGRKPFLEVLDGNHEDRVGLLHFAGHGRADHGVKDGGLRLDDGWIGVNDVYQSAVRLGLKDAPLVVLNACESGAGDRFLGMNTGWGMAFADRGFGGLIAPLWEVDDEVAFDIMKAALAPLVEGRSNLGEALADARRAHGDRSVSAFAYLAHGDVMAKFPA